MAYRLASAFMGVLVGVLAIVGLAVAGLVVIGLWAAHPVLGVIGLIIIAFCTIVGWIRSDAS